MSTNSDLATSRPEPNSVAEARQKHKWYVQAVQALDELNDFLDVSSEKMAFWEIVKSEIDKAIKEEAPQSGIETFSLADDAFWVAAEAVPQSGRRVRRHQQYARWVDGSTHLRIGRSTAAGIGGVSKGLRFDALKQRDESVRPSERESSTMAEPTRAEG